MPGPRDPAHVTRSHTYTFSFSGVPTGEQVMEEIAKGLEAVGPGAKVRFRVTDSQRDGYDLSATVSK